MAKRMVRVKYTVTVTSEIEAENYTTGHTLKNNGRQMTDDEIRDFEMHPDASLEIRNEYYCESLIEALQIQPMENQDWAVTVEFFNKED